MVFRIPPLSFPQPFPPFFFFFFFFSSRAFISWSCSGEGWWDVVEQLPEGGGGRRRARLYQMRRTIAAAVPTVPDVRREAGSGRGRDGQDDGGHAAAARGRGRRRVARGAAQDAAAVQPCDAAVHVGVPAVASGDPERRGVLRGGAERDGDRARHRDLLALRAP